MDNNGEIIVGGSGGDPNFDDITANSICAKQIKVSSDECKTIEYTLPQVGPSGNGQVILGDIGGFTTWSELPSISNVEQRRILDEEIGLETFQQTYNASNAYNNFWKVLNGNDETIYSSLVVCPNDAFRVFAYNNPPVTTGDLYKGANMAGGDGFAGGVDIYSHLYKDYDLSSFNDIPYDEVELEVWLGTSGTPAYTYNVYIDIITSGSLPSAPVFNVQYSGVSPAVETGINTPNNRIERYSYKLNQQVICQASQLRVVFEAVTQTGGFLANEYQTNTLGNTATRFRLSGLFNSSSGGTVIPPALIDHDVLIGAIGRQTHDEIDAELTTINNDITTINGQITTINNDLTGKLNIDGSNAMTANLNMGGNDIINLNKADFVNNSSIGDLGSDLLIATNGNLLLDAPTVINNATSNLLRINGNSFTNQAELQFSNINNKAFSIIKEDITQDLVISNDSNDLMRFSSTANGGKLNMETELNMNDNNISWSNSSKIEYSANGLNIIGSSFIDLEATDSIAMLSNDLMGFLSTNNMNIRSSDGDVRIRANLGNILIAPDVGNIDIETPAVINMVAQDMGINASANIGIEAQNVLGLTGLTAELTAFDTATVDGVVTTEIKSTSGDVNLSANNNININQGVDRYTLPPNRATAGQVLTDINGNGFLSWEDNVAVLPQPLATGDSPSFVNLNLEDGDLTINRTSETNNHGVKFTTSGLPSYEWFIRQQNEGSDLELRDSDGLNIDFGKFRTRFKGQLETNINTANSFLFPAVRGTAGQILTDNTGNGVLSWEDLESAYTLTWGGSSNTQALRYLNYSGVSNQNSAPNLTALRIFNFNPKECYIVGCSAIRQNASANTTFTVSIESAVNSGLFNQTTLITIPNTSQTGKVLFGSPIVIPVDRLMTVSISDTLANPQQCTITLYISYKNNVLSSSFTPTTTTNLTAGPALFEEVAEMNQLLTELTN